MYWKGDPRLPEPQRRPGEAVAVVISIEEWIDRQDRSQLTAFVEHAGFEFTLSAPGHDEIQILRDAFCGSGTSGDGGFQAFYVCLDPETTEAIAPGIEYTLTPINAGDAHAWTVRACRPRTGA